MAIQPIDLQVLFSRLDQVGKEQAVQKEVPLHDQVVQGSEIAKRTEQQDHMVNLSQEVVGNGAPKVGDKKKKRERSSKEATEERKKSEKTEDAPEEIVRDPNLGKNIDLIG